jgi:hypothetical protein
MACCSAIGKRIAGMRVQVSKKALLFVNKKKQKNFIG